MDRTRDAAAYVRGDMWKIGNDRLTRKSPCTGRFAASTNDPDRRSEWLYDGENHDRDHEQGRDFVHQPVEPPRTGIAVGCEVPDPARENAVDRRQRQDQHEFCLEPAHLEPAA